MRTAVFLCLLACAKGPVEAGTPDVASCANDRDCPSGFACDGGACRITLAPKTAKFLAPQCQSCREDADCGDDGSAGCWLPNAGGRMAYCAFDCTTQACPVGLKCRADIVGGTKSCWPEQGACPRNPEDADCSGDESWSTFGQAFFKAHCANCHGKMATLDGVKQQAAAISEEVTSGKMPPKEILDPDDVALLGTWIDCGLKP